MRVRDFASDTSRDTGGDFALYTQSWRLNKYDDFITNIGAGEER